MSARVGKTFTSGNASMLNLTCLLQMPELRVHWHFSNSNNAQCLRLLSITFDNFLACHDLQLSTITIYCMFIK